MLPNDKNDDQKILYTFFNAADTGICTRLKSDQFDVRI